MDQDVFDIRKFDEYKEDNRREVKKAKGGLPLSLGTHILHLRIVMAELFCWEFWSGMMNKSKTLFYLFLLNRISRQNSFLPF